jgi:hypothetical protein
MRTFYEFLSDLSFRLWLIETYFSFDAGQYNQLFDDELQKLSVSSPEYRDAVERMRGCNWVGYIAKSLRNAGCRDQREVQERTHDIVVKFLTGGLFRDYDERQHGPLDLRFKRAVTNAIGNMTAKERNRRRLLPTVAAADDLPAKSWAGADDEKIIRDFRRLVKRRLGDIGLAVLDLRLAGGETKSLVGSPTLGSPGKWIVKRVVCQIKELAREFAVSSGDSELLRRIEKAMAGEEDTIQKRAATAARRQAVGA